MSLLGQRTVKQIRRIFIAIAGVTVLLVGLAMTVLPGPAIVVIPIGLAILATEFVWARRLLDKAKQSLRRSSPGPDDSGPPR